MKTMNRRRAGFTLIELMVVIAIIGVVASYAMPAYQDYITKGRLTSVLSVTQTYLKRKGIDYSQNSSWGGDSLIQNEVAQLASNFDFAQSASHFFSRDGERLVVQYRLQDMPGVDGLVDMKFAVWPQQSGTTLRVACYLQKNASVSMRESVVPEGCSLSNYK